MNLKIDIVNEIDVKKIAVVVTETMNRDVAEEKDVAVEEKDAVAVEEIDAALDFLVADAIVGGSKN